MSRASKVTLAATTLATAGMIYFVHWAQEADKAVRTHRCIPDLNGTVMGIMGIGHSFLSY